MTLRHDQYRFRFYLNASHGIYLSGKLGEIHPHTWEIVINVMKATDDFSPFHEVEKLCDSFLSNFQDILINDIPPFTTVNPTLENLTAFFKEEIQERLREIGWMLLSIEISETPARTYIISTVDEAVGSIGAFDVESEETLQSVVDGLAKKRVISLEDVAGDDQSSLLMWEAELKKAEEKVRRKNPSLFNKKVVRFMNNKKQRQQ